jgi:hypothetical protein
MGEMDGSSDNRNAVTLCRELRAGVLVDGKKQFQYRQSAKSETAVGTRGLLAVEFACD